MPKRVAKPTSNIKHMLLNAGSSSKKKKQVCMIRVRKGGREGGVWVVTWLFDLEHHIVRIIGEGITGRR